MYIFLFLVKVQKYLFQFFRKNKLLQHMDGHAEEKMHVCHVCGKFSSKRFSLFEHDRLKSSLTKLRFKLIITKEL